VIAGLQARYCEISGVKSLKVKHNNVLGYFIEVPAASAAALQSPDKAGLFIHRQTVASAMRFITTELASLDQRIAAAGRTVSFASAEEAAGRGVAGMFRTSDPAGNGLEFYYGDTITAVPFVSPQGVPGFVTGELGMGHAVLSAPNFAETVAFYCDVVGFGKTDMPRFYFMGGPPEDPGMGFAFLHATNGRHHSLALGEGPIPPSGCVHLMLELPDLIEVGKAHDRMRAEGFTESASLGRHVNDEMTSFYVQTPAGFDLEIGYDGLVIDPASWETTQHDQISVWGHVWAWQEALKQSAAE
jgi:3,4-dihydroxy-9,10-secoandrosta-1,3,5(10)-triene-9,17-dione 4,5-dioxygenase